MFAVRFGPAAAKLRPLLDDQFEIMRVGLEELGISGGRGAELAQAFDARHGREDVLVEAEQDLEAGRPEEVILAAEIAIDGALAHACPVGDDLDVGAAEADFGKGADGLIQYGLPLVGVFGATAVSGGHSNAAA